MTSAQDPLELLKQFQVPYLESSTTEWVKVACVYHKESNQDDLNRCHGGINKISGAFNCFSCGRKTTVINFLATKMGASEEIIQMHRDNILGTARKGHVDAAMVEVCHKELLANAEYQELLLNKHGITRRSIETYRLGFYGATHRIHIPIKNRAGVYINVRQYSYDPADKKKKILSVKGAPNSLYPWEALADAEETVYVTEGEFKAIVLRQNGFNAICTTGGAGFWDEDYNYLFKDKHVVVIYDVDKAGRAGAEKLCVQLHRYAKSIKNVHLTEVQDIPNGDITDYFVKRLKTADDLQTLISSTPYFQHYSTVSALTLSDDPPVSVKLSDASKATYNGKLIELAAVVSSKTMAPFIVPKKCTLVCGRDQDGCSLCPGFRNDRAFQIEVAADDPALIDMIMGSDKSQQELLKKKAQIYRGCRAHSFKIDESYNVEELRLVPQIAIGHSTDEQVVRRAYYVGHGLSSNNSYKFKARACAHPEDHTATMVCYESEPTADDIDTFKEKFDLTIFQPTEWTLEGLEAKLDNIYEDLENNVTKIFQRRDLHIFYDLAWHSVLYFDFDGRTSKGWADVLVIGDSGQGKSETSTRLISHYKCGERVDTKRASVAGIVGGVQSTGTRWFITWGTIPLNDRRLVVLEEIKGMPAPELARMTDMRSSGIAEIHRIERARTSARARLVWISNPRSDNKMSAYSYGVEAVKELIGSLEDIRRFDMVIAVASGEVSIDTVNRRHTSDIPHTYTSDICSHLVAWTWSRKENQVEFEQDAIDEALAVAGRMGRKYSASCPIVEPSDQRIKIARLSAALAARTFSTNDERLKVIVRKCHVQFIEKFLNRIYDSRALGYGDYSVAQKGDDYIDDVDAVKKYMLELPHSALTIRALLESDIIRTEDIQNFTDWDPQRSNDAIGKLSRMNCLKRMRRGGYKKTSAYIDILKELDRATTA